MRPWLLYAIVTTLFWGVWGALIEIPERAGFPATLGYSVWALTMVPCALFAFWIMPGKLERDRRSVLLGLTVGLLGAGGQLILFEALRLGPAYLIFPIISLYPVLTIVLSVWRLKEQAARRSWVGIGLALVAIFCLSYQPPSQKAVEGYLWLLLAFLVFAMWGIQAYTMKFSNQSMQAEGIFFYMMLSGVLLIPFALLMTDFSQAINWSWSGPGAAAAIQVLNSVGALCLVYALRYGKAIIVVPMTALAPVLTVLLSLAIWQVIPHPLTAVGIVLASVAIYLMAE